MLPLCSYGLTTRKQTNVVGVKHLELGCDCRDFSVAPVDIE